MPNLWPEDINDFSTDDEPTPLNILKEQARILGEKTKNIIQGELRKVVEISIISRKPKDTIVYNFNFRVPSLENYGYALFKTRFNMVDTFPIIIEIEDISIINEINKKLASYDGDLNMISNDTAKKLTLEMNGISEFMKILGFIFNTQRTKKILHSLYNQAIQK